MTEPRDAELARRCRRGDPEAWRLLVRRVGPLVYRVAVRVLGDGPEAEDAGQEALLRVHRSFASYDATRPIEPWVARVAYNVCLQSLARRRRPGGAGVEGDAVAWLEDEGAPSPEALAAQAERDGMVSAALARLAPADRVLVTLTYQDGMSNAEVAEVMEMPVGTVKTRLHRARARLRALLGPGMAGGGR